jgi:hypothetical protein
VLDDFERAPIDDRVRATLRLLRKMTLKPDALGVDDVRTVLAQGVSREAVRDAMYVCYLFCTYDRLADAFGWHVPSPEAFEAGARVLLKRGYL